MARHQWRDGLSDDDIDEIQADRRYQRRVRERDLSDPDEAILDPLPATREEYEQQLAEENAGPEEQEGGANALTWDDLDARWGLAAEG